MTTRAIARYQQPQLSKTNRFARALDSFLWAISPSWGRRRRRERILAEQYEGAALGRRTSSWSDPAGGPNEVSAWTLDRLRRRARDVTRNNGWMARARRVIANSVVGTGIECKVRARQPEIQARAQEIWDEWCESTGGDYDGRLNFYGLQGLVMRAIPESGEVLVIAYPARSDDGVPLTAPLRVRVLEPDYLDSGRLVGEGGREVVQGIELDGRGRRTAYWVFPHSPGNSLYRPASERIPAARVLHIYAVDRPGQLRGVPWYAPVMTSIHELDDLEDARLMQAKIAALFGAFVTDIEGSGPGRLGPSEGTAPAIESMEPGAVHYLAPGESIEVAEPPKFDSGEESFARHFLRKLAAGIGITYEDLTGDYSRVNFSSARMARLAFGANVDAWRAHMLIPMLCDGVFRWVMSMASELEGWGEVPKASWTAPPLPAVNPREQVDTDTQRVRSGFASLPEIVRERGGDFDQLVEEQAEALAAMRARGIVSDADPSKVSRGGQAQSENATIPSD